MNIITPLLIESLAMNEVPSQLPTMRTKEDIESLSEYVTKRNMVNVVMRQMNTISIQLWVRSFLERYKGIIRRTSRRRALEKHKATKH